MRRRPASVESAAATAPPVLITQGMMLDSRYRLEALPGRGGTAEVYRGTDVLLGRSVVVVKAFDSRLTDLNTVVRQRKEMQLLAALNHPNLIAVYDARVADTPSAGWPGAAGVHHRASRFSPRWPGCCAIR